MIVAYGLCALLVISGCSSRTNGYDLRKLGLEYQLMELNDPRPNRVHILRVDFSERKAEASVVIPADSDGTGPAEVALTNPLKLANDRSGLAFINTNAWNSFPDSDGEINRNWYEGQLVDIVGLAISDGDVRSSAGPDQVSVWITKDGRVSLGDAYDTTAMEGMGQLSCKGEAAIQLSASAINTQATCIS